MLKLSLILPTHDRPVSLARAVDSVLAQSVLPHEVIVANDGSLEIPADVARNLKAAGVRFRQLRSPVASLTRSRNLGTDAATGDVVAHMDDDLVLPNDFAERLLALYEADTEQVVCGIGAVVEDHRPRRLQDKLWDILAALTCGECWRPRRCAARYVRLPPALRGKLFPARRLRGGGMSFRRKALAGERFDEALTGYALGEDMAFSYAFGSRHALFVAPSLKVTHYAIPSGRLDMKDLGRMYATNTLHIARTCLEGGAGAWLLVGLDLAGTIVRYTLWGLLTASPKALRYAAGTVAGLAAAGRGKLRELLCGC